LGASVDSQPFAIDDTLCGLDTTYSLSPAAPSYMTFDAAAKTISIESTDLADAGGPTSYTLTGSFTALDGSTISETMVFNVEIVDPCLSTSV
jgi:hypothetical protein